MSVDTIEFLRGFASIKSGKSGRTKFHLVLVVTLLFINAVSYSIRRGHAKAVNDDPVCGYIERQQFSASDGRNGDRFGQSVAVHSITLPSMS